jgi:tetratricopeptide (TPR) repeat protein
MSSAGKGSPSPQARTRIELVRGHWSLGERDEALVCLERLAAAEPAAGGLRELVEELRAELESESESALGERFAALVRQLSAVEPIAPLSGSPLVTGTLASLLVEQGHTEQALAVAEDVLRTRPDDVRARAVRERLRASQLARVIERLEHWLGNIERLKRGSAQA